MTKTFKLCYTVPYNEPPIPPYNLVLLSKNENRMIFSYKRPIKDNKNILVGEASYLIHIYNVEISPDLKSGTMYGTFSAHHEVKKNNNNYDIMLTGNCKWVLGIRPGQQNIDPNTPYLFIVGNDLDCISATSIFKNNNKINHGNNIVIFNSTGQYKIIGKKDKYNYLSD